MPPRWTINARLWAAYWDLSAACGFRAPALVGSSAIYGRRLRTRASLKGAKPRLSQHDIRVGHSMITWGWLVTRRERSSLQLQALTTGQEQAVRPFCFKKSFRKSLPKWMCATSMSKRSTT